MQPSTRNRSKGTARLIKGRVKETAGRLSGNPRLKARGRFQAAAGKFQRKLGQAEREVEKDLERDVEDIE